MAAQLDLFDSAPAPAQYDDMPAAPEPVARARASDPASSHEAAERMNRGVANVQRQQVIDAVWKWPGRTSKELAKLDGELDRHEFGRRLPEAEDAGDVHLVAEGKAELRWFPGRKAE